MKRKDIIALVETKINEGLTFKFDERVRDSWENFCNVIVAEIENIKPVTIHKHEQHLMRFFIQLYIKLEGRKCRKNPVWIGDVYRFIQENNIEDVIFDATVCLKDTKINQETWDVAVFDEPGLVEMYLWYVEGEIDDEIIEMLRIDAELDIFIEALKNMLNRIKRRLHFNKTPLEIKELYKSCVCNFYETWCNGKLASIIACWDQNELEEIEEKYIPFIQNNY